MNEEEILVDPRQFQASITKAKFEVPIDSPALKKPSIDFDFSNPPFDPIQFSKDLVDTMLAYGGLGIAAPQVEYNYNILAMRGDPMLVMFNPRIVDWSKENIVLEEGCISYPGMYFEISRPRWVKVRFQYPNSETVTQRYEDLSARVVSHEISHLRGLTMYDALSTQRQKEQFRLQLKKLKRSKK